ncbi:hypothetical protein DRW07_02105 [Alteromonas sediminis]|uniref:Uncharacterized protein n=1 Tax=Alteromonas sediminis TaxID=2259342 RepID=A0A3N5ZAR5_9ALTE|nr:hypothetical protein [Alteromonas sediminis]RPJ68224.1 hypothetical protein DRW07_02105 [Alteromonas sediminis]
MTSLSQTDDGRFTATVEPESVTLFECDNPKVSIVFHRNLQEQCEYVSVSYGIATTNSHGMLYDKRIFLIHEYAALLPFEKDIVSYITQCEHRHCYFEAFLNLSVHAFFRGINRAS